MQSKYEKLWKTEDWWAVWLGLGIILFAFLMYQCGQAKLLGSFAVSAPRWGHITDAAVIQHLSSAWPWYFVLLLAFGAIFTISTRIMGHRPKEYVPGFAVVFAASSVILFFSNSKFAHNYNLEAPLLALIVGLIVGNLMRMPKWMEASLRTEYYIKTGIVLLGATLPLTLIVSAGPIAFLQATIVSISTWLVIYLATTRIFKKEPQFGAVLGAAGAVCGVSASIAVGASVKAKKEQIAIAISIVTIWAIVMIFFIPLMSRALGLPTAVAGAWVGTSEFADAAGFAAAQAYSPPMPQDLLAIEEAVRQGSATEEQVRVLNERKPHYENENAIRAFTLMKVIGRDIWIGIWCLILSVVCVAFWERGSGERVGVRVVWDRFPKFVIGFIIASVLMTLIVKFYGAEAADAFAKIDKELIKPIKTLRTWTFVFTFLCIGLTTRFKDLSKFGWEPFWAFTIGVAVNVPLGFFLSAYAFRDFWLRIALK
ncbi:MAG: putative sulfate exporter family transporter [Acidobacteriota bacterium]